MWDYICNIKITKKKVIISRIKRYGITLIMAKFRSISAVSFTFGNGISSGISTSRNSHKGAQPSDTE